MSLSAVSRRDFASEIIASRGVAPPPNPTGSRNEAAQW